jgi:hypothetical protein
MFRPKTEGRKIFNVERKTTTVSYETVIILATDEFEANEIAERNADTLDWMGGAETETEVEFNAVDDAAHKAEVARLQAAVAAQNK